MKRARYVAPIFIFALTGTIFTALPAHAAAKSTTTSLTTSAAEVTINSSATFTATVSATGGTPTGSVNFHNGANLLGNCTLASGSCSLSYTWAARGQYSVIATYVPSGNFAASTSAAVNQVVIRYTSSVVVTSSKPNAYIGNPLDFTITASGSGGTPTGSAILYAYDSNTVIGNCTLASGSCVIHLAASTVGNHRVWASYSGDDVTYLPANSPYIYQNNVAKLTPTLVVEHSPSSSDLGSQVTITATISGSGGVPTGAVVIENGEGVLGTCTLSAGNCSISISTLHVGSHQISAEYGGDATYAGGTATATHIVHSIVGPSLTANPVQIVIGSSVTLTATFPDAGSYAGTVVLREDGTEVGTCRLAASTCNYSYLPTVAAQHQLSATILGNATVETSTVTLSMNVLARTSVLLLTSNANPAPRLTLVTFTAVLHSSATGLVIFEENDAQLGTCTLSAGRCSSNLSFATLGDHQIVAEYVGDSSNSSATATLTQVVGITPTTVTLTSDRVDATYYDTINFTAVVSESDATGTIEVFDGATGIKSCTLAAGTCSLFYYRLSVGSHSMTAVYSGDSNHAGSTSTTLVQVVTLGATSISMESSENPFTQAAGMILTATVVSSGIGATGIVHFEDYTNSPEVMLGSCTLSGSTCSIVLDTPLPTGSRKLRAEYASDGNYAGSISSQFNQVIHEAGVVVVVLTTKETSTAVISANPTSLFYLDAMTITATLSSTGGTPNGRVYIEEALDNQSDVILGSCILIAGSCTYVNSTLAVGTHTIYLEYGGTTAYTSATSQRISVIIKARPVQVKPAPTEVKAPSPVVELQPSKTINTAIGPSTPAVVEFSKSNQGGGTVVVKVVVPAGVVPGAATLTIAASGSPSTGRRDFQALEIKILSSDFGVMTKLDKPLQLKIPPLGTYAKPATSQDGITWVAIKKVDSASLGEGVLDGYFLGADNSMTVMTMHLSVFDVMKKQYSLYVKAASTSVKVGGSIALSTRGGAGSGALTYSTSTPALCSVSNDGVVKGLAAGACSVVAAKGSDNSYMNAVSAPKVIAIRP